MWTVLKKPNSLRRRTVSSWRILKRKKKGHIYFFFFLWEEKKGGCCWMKSSGRLQKPQGWREIDILDICICLKFALFNLLGTELGFEDRSDYIIHPFISRQDLLRLCCPWQVFGNLLLEAAQQWVLQPAESLLYSFTSYRKDFLMPHQQHPKVTTASSCWS